MSARFLSLSLLALWLGCGDGGAAHTHVDAGREPESGSEPGDEAEFEGCPESTPPFALGMQAEGKRRHVTATLIDASNVPPLRYLNDWIVELSDSAGTPLSDVTVVSARPFMPVHGHDGNVKPVVRATALPGRFEITGFNLNMRGPWEIQLQLRSPSAGDDDVVFEICVQE